MTKQEQLAALEAVLEWFGDRIDDLPFNKLLHVCSALREELAAQENIVERRSDAPYVFLGDDDPSARPQNPAPSEPPDVENSLIAKAAVKQLAPKLKADLIAELKRNTSPEWFAAWENAEQGLEGPGK